MALTKRRKASLTRGGLYLLMVAAVVAAVLFADWEAIGRVFLNPEIMAGMLPEAITIGVRNTLLYTFGAFTFGFILALFLALMRLSPVAPYRWLRPHTSRSFGAFPH